jgi:hypothetical protein
MSFLSGLLPSGPSPPAECVVRVSSDQHEISDLYDFLVEVTVECSRHEAAVAHLKFESHRDDHGSFIVQDHPDLVAWQPIMIEAAFGPRTEEVFRGYIREVKAEYPEDPGRATVMVDCQDESISLDREHARKRWMSDSPTSDDVILSTILSSYSSAFGGALSPAPDAAAGLSGITLNQDATDARFLQERAEANGYELIYSGGQVYFGPMRLDGDSQSTILIYAGASTNCISFSARVDGHAPYQVAFDLADGDNSSSSRVTVSPDPSLRLLGTRSAQDSQGGLKDFTWVMAREGSGDEQALRAKAQQRANDLSMRVHGEGELDGSLYGHVLTVGQTVGVDGAGDTFSGTYYVDTVRHRFSDTGYRETFALLRNGLGDDLGGLGGAGGLLAGAAQAIGGLFG